MHGGDGRVPFFNIGQYINVYTWHDASIKMLHVQYIAVYT